MPRQPIPSLPTNPPHQRPVNKVTQAELQCYYDARRITDRIERKLRDDGAHIESGPLPVPVDRIKART